ncbi:hypothetical protein EWB00_009150 [Schistosoma japonicum]|uniref:PKC-activated phosphatase-1 inhibitor n=2 Tax=Schistosoma japonicum TaxID=6182 RepID=A0A4Z2CMX9_SCHJA|nr:hypothetical protein EWB00_009150 [Schistosoma japonicum]
MFSIHQCKWIEGMNLSKETNEHSDGFSQKSVNREVVFATDAPSDHSKRKRYLTAKYDRRTRQKISEKIKIENFVFDQLRALYSTEIDDYDCDIDVDEISDLETNEEKIRVLKEKLKSCPARPEEIESEKYSKHTNYILKYNNFAKMLSEQMCNVMLCSKESYLTTNYHQLPSIQSEYDNNVAIY